MIRRGLATALLATLATWGAGQVFAAPLTLDAVLAHADANHPDVDLARAQQAIGDADVQLARSLNDFRVSLDAALRGGRNALYNDHFQPDHLIRLNARKTLLDFGRQQTGMAANEQESQARALQLLDVRAQRRLTLMTRFFDVLLADLRDGAETEALAVAYVSWDNARERLAVGQLAQWELSELEARYLDSLTRRNDVRRELREKRMALGAAMNLPGMLLEDLVDPKLPANERALPEFDALFEVVKAENPQLLAHMKLLASATQRINGVRAENRPSLEFEAEAAAWSREATARDDLRAGLNFNWPIWQGKRIDARMAREQARFHELQARHDALLMNLRQSLLATREEIQLLRNATRRSEEVNATYREQFLEKARAEYEMELKTNLGSAMAETQFANFRQRAIEYRLALAWARLEALVGGPEQWSRHFAKTAQEDKK